MDMKEILELLILSTEKFGMIYTLVIFALIGVFVYLMRNKSKAEKVLTVTLEEMSKANSESVKITAENIKEIKVMTLNVLENTNQLSGEIRGIVDIIKFLLADYQSRKKNEDNEGGEH